MYHERATGNFKPNAKAKKHKDGNGFVIWVRLFCVSAKSAGKNAAVVLCHTCNVVPAYGFLARGMGRRRGSGRGKLVKLAACG